MPASRPLAVENGPPNLRRLRCTLGTSVPGLIAKPIIDIVLVVSDSADESTYAPALEAVGYRLRIRSPAWDVERR